MNLWGVYVAMWGPNPDRWYLPCTTFPGLTVTIQAIHGLSAAHRLTKQTAHGKNCRRRRHRRRRRRRRRRIAGHGHLLGRVGYAWG